MVQRSKELHQAIRGELHAAGLRATPARVAVLRVLREAEGPLTHAEVVERLEGEHWDRATIFRNLMALTEVDFVSRSDLGDRVWRFEASRQSGGELVHEHPHFLCIACGNVQCIDGVEVKVHRGARLPNSVRAQAVQVQLRGLCDACI